MFEAANAVAAAAEAAEDEEDEESEEYHHRQREKLESSESGAAAVWNMVKDLHLELLFMYHRVCLKLANVGKGNYLYYQ